MLSREQFHTATRLLNRLGRGDVHAGDELSPLIHGELWELASFVLRKRGADATLQPTELVNEAWVRFAGQQVAVKGAEVLAGRARRLEGELLGLVEDENGREVVRLRLAGGDEVEIPKREIESGHIVFRLEVKQKRGRT